MQELGDLDKKIMRTYKLPNDAFSVMRTPVSNSGRNGTNKLVIHIFYVSLTNDLFYISNLTVESNLRKNKANILVQ